MTTIKAYLALNGDDLTGELNNEKKPFRTHGKCIEMLLPLEAPGVELEIHDMMLMQNSAPPPLPEKPV